MATWAAFETAMPEMAAVGRHLLMQHGVGLGFLATTRADGGPRVHPVCPHVVGSDLWVFVIPHSPKCSDLERDGRYALHTFPCDDRDDGFYVTGDAIRIDDRARRESVVPGFRSRVEPDEVMFRLTIERALLSIYGPRTGDVQPPVQTRWRA